MSDTQQNAEQRIDPQDCPKCGGSGFASSKGQGYDDVCDECGGQSAVKPLDTTEQRIAEITARAEKATPGPMEVVTRKNDFYGEVNHFWKPAGVSEWDSTLIERVEDAEFYAASRDDIPWLLEQLSALRAFESYIHRRLDEANVPTHPDGPHSHEGCRVGDRLDIVFGELSALRAANAKLSHQCRAIHSLKAADAVALAAFDLIERRIIPTRSRLSDALEVYADNRFDVMDGSGIAKLRGVVEGEWAFPSLSSEPSP